MDLITRAEDAVEMALGAGAQGAWASASSSREVEFNSRDGKLEKVQENTSRSLSIQLYVDGRYSSHSTTSLVPERLKSFVGEAVALTRALQPDEHRALPDPALFEGRSEADLQITDAGIDAFTNEQRDAWLQAMDAEARADDRVISATGYVSTSRGEGAAVSSNGFAGTWGGTSVWVGASATVRDEGDARPEGGLWLGSRRLDQLQDPAGVAKEALRRAVDRLGSTKGPTTTATMVVDPQIAGRLLGRLLGAANARSIAQGRSVYTGKLGQKLFPELFSVVDEPLLPGGMASRHFDGEGIAAKTLPIIEAGVLQNIWVDTYYGKKAGLAPTSGGRSNLLVKPGVDKGLTELIADAGEGVYVTSWLGGNADGTTGDFSFGLRGHLIEKGAIGRPVSEMNVTGNLLDLFGRLAVVGNDPWPFRSVQVPTLVFEGVSFSGA